MNNIIKSTLAKVELLEDINSLEVKLDTLQQVHENVKESELEIVVNEQIKTLKYKINNVDFVFDLVNKIAEIKDINKEFYKTFWSSDIGTENFKEILNNLEKSYNLMDGTEGLNIKKDILNNIIVAILQSYPLDIDKLVKYKNELKKII